MGSAALYSVLLSRRSAHVDHVDSGLHQITITYLLNLKGFPNPFHVNWWAGHKTARLSSTRIPPVGESGDNDEIRNQNLPKLVSGGLDSVLITGL